MVFAFCPVSLKFRQFYDMIHFAPRIVSHNAENLIACTEDGGH
jgi:hypothetical protein